MVINGLRCSIYGVVFLLLIGSCKEKKEIDFSAELNNYGLKIHRLNTLT